jgi:hypothetical protein
MKTSNGKPAKKTPAKKTAGAKKSGVKTAAKKSKKSDDLDDEFEEFGIDDEFRDADFKSINNSYDDEDEDY